MKKFIILYNGPATPMEQMTPEAREKVRGAWQAWMEKCGDAMVDMGQPMANGEAVVDDGSNRDSNAVEWLLHHSGRRYGSGKRVGKRASIFKRQDW